MIHKMYYCRPSNQALHLEQMVATRTLHGFFEHFRSGSQPSGLAAFVTQGFALGWDMAAPLALNKNSCQLKKVARQND